jgi:transcription elongation GreA/GreB family factor
VWLELCELEPADLEWFLLISKRLGTSRRKEQAAFLLQLALPYYEAHERWDDALTILRQAAEFAPGDLSIREAVVKALRARHAGAPALERIFDHCGLRRGGDVFQSLECAERLIPFSDGEACYHPDWGIGLVRQLDLFSERVTIDFERKKGHEMTVDLAQDVLKPLPHRDIRAAWLRESERVARLVTEDPVQIIKMALTSLGGKATTREIKDRLCGSVIPEKQWSKWWGNTSALLRRDPYIGSSGGVAKTYVLREEAGTADNEWMEAFDKKRNPLEKIDLVLSYLRSVPRAELSSDLLCRFAVSLSALAQERRGLAVRAELYLTLEDIKEVEPSAVGPPETAREEILADRSVAVDVLAQLRREEHQWRLAERLRDRHPGAWLETCQDLILTPRSLIRDRLARSLRSEDLRHVLEDLARRVAPVPREYPGAFVWFAEQVLLNPQEAVSLGIEPPVLVERLLGLVDFLTDRAKRVEKDEAESLRISAAALRSLIKRDNFAILRNLLANMDRSVALSLYKRASGNAGLDVRAREQITRRILSRFPDLFAASDEESARLEEFLCTHRSLEARRARLRQIIDVELPRITNQIEEAREQGDLSENAEYHAARDRQKTLFSEAAEIREQIWNARPVDLSTVVPDQVRFGVCFRIRTPEEQKETYTVLGPLESDPEKNVLSYQAPFVRCFVGKKAGETVRVDLPNRSGDFYISAVEPIPPDILAPFS